MNESAQLPKYPSKRSTWMVLAFLLGLAIYWNTIDNPPFQLRTTFGDYTHEPYGWPLSYAVKSRLSKSIELVSPFAVFLNVLIVPTALFFLGLLLDRWRAIKIRLSTAIIVMFVASGLVGLNTLSPDIYKIQEKDMYLNYGWPFVAYQKQMDAQTLSFVSDGFIWNGVAENAAIALILMSATAILSEWYFRRRDRNAAQKLK